MVRDGLVAVGLSWLQGWVGGRGTTGRAYGIPFGLQLLLELECLGSRGSWKVLLLLYFEQLFSSADWQLFGGGGINS